MESPGQDMELLQAFISTQSVRMNRGASSDQDQELQDDSETDIKPESDQGTLEPGNLPPLQALIEFRIQQLHNRRFLLLKTQHFRKTEDRSGGTADENEDGDKLSELEVIQKELEELLVKKEKLENQGQSSQLSHPDVTPTFTETPHGGIYVLPPLQQTQEDTRLERRVATTPAAEPTTGPVVPAHLDVTPTFTETFRGGIYVLQPPQQTQEDTRLERRVATTPAAEPTTTGPVVPVNRLGRTAALTQCPSCLEVVFTKTHNTLGEAMCLLCCLSSAFGCVAGCCVIPFFMDSLKDVHHQCPQCQSHIHTFRPF